MADVDITVGLIAAGAAFGGALLALGGDFMRRRWEDGRRWSEVKRHACREFLFASRVLYGHVQSVKKSSLAQRDLRARHTAMSEEVAAGKYAPEMHEDLAAMRGEIAHIKARHADLEAEINPNRARVNEASADIVILCSPRLQALAAAHEELIMAIHAEDLEAMPLERATAFLEGADRKVGESQDAFRREVRRELGIDRDG